MHRDPLELSTSLRQKSSDALTTTLVAAAFGLLFASAGISQVTVFEHADFRGRSSTFYESVYNLKGTHVGNDRATSIVVDPGCTAVLYKDSEFRGPAIEVRGQIENLRHTAVGNDRVSSIDIRCGRSRSPRARSAHRHGPNCGHDGYDRSYDDRSRYSDSRNERPRYSRQSRDRTRYDRPDYDRRSGGVGLHKDDRYSGRTIWISGPIANLRRTHLGNDELTSVTVPRGCRVTLFDDANFRGRALVLYEDVPNLRHTRVGNDRVSSVDIECSGRR